MHATYYKLRSGEWGVRVKVRAGEKLVISGDKVEVVKKDGTWKTETVDQILWTGREPGQDVQLCTVRGSERGQNSGSHYERGVGQVCDECGEKAIPGSRCWETGAKH